MQSRLSSATFFDQWTHAYEMSDVEIPDPFQFVPNGRAMEAKRKTTIRSKRYRKYRNMHVSSFFPLGLFFLGLIFFPDDPSSSLRWAGKKLADFIKSGFRDRHGRSGKTY